MENEYKLLEVPLSSKHSDIIEMDLEELKRLCKAKHILRFTLKVNNIINAFGHPEKPKQPYLKHFVFLHGIWLVAKEKIEDAPQEAQ